MHHRPTQSNTGDEMQIESFYQNDYGDGTHYVAVKEADGTKTVVLRGMCRAVAVTCCTFGNDYWLKGTYKAGMDDYFDSIVEQIAIIDADRAN
jgi:hypothetical protein